jgi:hypothetical protein
VPPETRQQVLSPPIIPLPPGESLAFVNLAPLQSVSFVERDAAMGLGDAVGGSRVSTSARKHSVLSGDGHPDHLQSPH